MTQQMAVPDEDVALGVEQVVRQAARLGAGATVGATVADVLTEIALSAMADAEGAVNKKLQRYGGLLSDGTYFLQTQLTTQNNLAKTKALKKLHLLHGKVVALRAGMQRDGRQVEVEELQVLHNERVDASVPAVVGQLPGAFQLVTI